ncbi:histidine kinase dimerization/phospho-acceptor domain-containing protein [Cobetia sp. ICG0124]|uniref:histidine kinase dimerization/phospho-acceptor domain-containing protein n=1 Tax=Cobetia sp. ICG0124 TaxID=2053669 RepID=UPI001F0B974F|nr:histidine kinase dimerization/phospho-acceptor domain-containing protein [Cobetia sp. ICG0124]
MAPDTPLTDSRKDGLSAELAALKARNRQLEKINAALIERVESSSPSPSAPYAAFEHAVLLADQVRERTDTLHRTLDELGALNRRLTAAKAAAEAANHSKTRFLAAISHDLLQPLNAARLFASALEEQLARLALDDPTPRDAAARRFAGRAGGAAGALAGRCREPAGHAGGHLAAGCRRADGRCRHLPGA